MSSILKFEVREYTCDLCGFTWIPDYWADNPSGGSIPVEDGFNGQEFFTWENLCRSCRKEIQQAVHEVIRRRRPKVQPNANGGAT